MTELAIITFVGVLINALVEGLALSLLWGWFVAPNLNIPVLSYWASVGIVLLINILSEGLKGSDIDNAAKTDAASMALATTLNLVRLVSVLFLGYLINSWQ